MLTADEISRLLKKERKMSDALIMQEAPTWDLSECRASPQMIATIYSYMTTKYEKGQSLFDIECTLGIHSDYISHSLRALEEHGYVTITRATKPFQYMVIK